MPLFFSCPCCLLAVLLSADPTEQTNTLIHQLGSDQFHQRQAATRALLKVGEPALGALRQAAIQDRDVEVRSRAARLVLAIEKQAIANVVASKCSNQDKLNKVREYVLPGITVERARQLLGTSILLRSKRSLFLGGPTHEFFSASGVLISHRNGKVTDVNLWEE
jgi:hypothetical protein